MTGKENRFHDLKPHTVRFTRIFSVEVLAESPEEAIETANNVTAACLVEELYKVEATPSKEVDPKC